MARLTPIGEECILAIPSGSLIVDGVEHYRAKKPDAGQSARAVSVSAGDYMLRCYAPPDTEETSPKSEKDLEAVIGTADLQYYERVTRSGCFIGPLLLLLFPLLLPLIGWKFAFPVTFVVVVAYFSLRERMLRRNERFARLREKIVAFRRGHEEPTFVLELRQRVIPSVSEG